ncbi:MAG: DMT family transporter [Desulfobacteraceae bacterium]|nr:DMT family transporter [Desulfobacteraceae bacterium]MBC2757438.1 DMT family transporter [Desulfobacteraceae bacterium]MBC2763842.1 DMT family transporter [ANME-2 cluster archaeon]
MNAPSLLAKLPSRLIVILGCLSILASAVFFYISTVFIRRAEAEVAIDASFFVFFRFIMGFFVICGILILQRRSLKPLRYNLLVGRTVFNCIAVFCFYRAVTVTSLAEANILNMTYPIFLAILSWFLLKEQRDLVAIIMVGVAFSGIWLILSPGSIAPNLQNLWGLASGISASLAILYLNISRQYHDTETILFYMFGLGSIIIFCLFYERIFWPNTIEFKYLFLCAVFGVGGQYLLTIGFRYVTAVEGAILSSVRILMAAILGPWIAFDPPLGVAGWIGAILIFLANVVLAFRKTGNA